MRIVFDSIYIFMGCCEKIFLFKLSGWSVFIDDFFTSVQGEEGLFFSIHLLFFFPKSYKR